AHGRLRALAALAVSASVRLLAGASLAARLAVRIPPNPSRSGLGYDPSPSEERCESGRIGFPAKEVRGFPSVGSNPTLSARWFSPCEVRCGPRVLRCEIVVC